MLVYATAMGSLTRTARAEFYIVRRPIPTGKPKFKAPTASGSRPYFSPLMPDGYLEDITIPLVLIEGPVKVDSCYEHIPVGFCFVGLTGTWNIVDRRGDDGVWKEENDTRVLPELKAIPMKGRQVHRPVRLRYRRQLISRQSRQVHANWAATGTGGAAPHKVCCRCEPDGRKNGADDFLVRHGAPMLIERLLSPKVIGWPLPAPLLTNDGDLRSDYDATEEQELIEHLSKITDIQLMDSTLRRVSKKIGRKYDELLALVEDNRAGDEDRGFLCSDEDLEQSDIDSKWIVPDVAPW